MAGSSFIVALMTLSVLSPAAALRGTAAALCTLLPPAALAQGGAAARPASESTLLLRTPTVSATHVAFAYANNIWVVERAGGSARRLTSFQGRTSNPKLSPDGRTVAFSAEYAGNIDVYTVPVAGGQPTRLTWHPAPDGVQGWTPDGKSVVFATTRATASPSPAPRFWTIPAAGGVETPMPMPRAFQGKISPDGRRIAYRMPSSWDEERRNYRGGQNKPIWVMDLRTHEVETPEWKDSKEMDPVWLGETVYFLSDRDGVSNVWSYDPRAKRTAQVTRFKDFDVKALDAGGGVLVLEQAGRIHELEPASGRTRALPITVAGDFPWMMPQWKDVTNRVTNLAISQSGRRVAVEARGEIFTIPAEKGDVRNLTNSSASAERAPVWSPDGQSVAYFSDRSGEYRLYIESQAGLGQPREIAIPEPSHYFAPAWAPNGRRIAFQDVHFRLWMVDVPSGRATVVDEEPFYGERSIVPAWSPDSRWIAYPKRLPSLFRSIWLYDADNGQKRQVTDGLADVASPAWDATGKYLWFLASTTLGLNAQTLDMSAYDRPITRALYMVVLSKDEPSPLLPESDEEAARAGAAPREPGRETPPRDSAAAGQANDSAARRDTTAMPRLPAGRPVRIDFEGIQNRIVAVPNVAERRYAALRAGPAGTVFFTELLTPSGTNDGPEQASGATLHRYQLTTRRAAEFARNVAQFAVSGDGRKLVYRTPGQQAALFLVDADKAVPAPNTGRLTAQLRAYVDPKAEFRQIFDEGWRNQRNNFYVKNLHGTDWPAVRRMYEPFLAHVNHRADLNYLLDVMGAELAIGHSYVSGGDLPEVPSSNPGLLGADFEVNDGFYRITRIYTAESWNPELRAPLSGPGINVATGDYLLAVDGVPLKAPDNVYRLLDGTANRQTVITVNSRPTMQGARQVTVIPVANEQGLRTRAWVERNRRIVDSLSDGTLAYVYVPNTGRPGFESFNRYYFAQQDRKGAVIDERFNGGGSAADYIVDILGRDFDGYFNNPVGERVPITSPAAGIWGPKVMIINEMAGSGGDLMPHMFKRRRIGPLVGTRTWGGLVATSDTPPFVDGGSMIAPRFGYIDREGNFAVENVGVAPDIEVENWPKDVLAGRDPQLERAVQEAMRLVREKPSDRLVKEPVAPTWGRRP